MSDTLEHECRQGKHCKGRWRDECEVTHPAGVEKMHSLCPACERSAFAAIRELHIDWRKLYLAVLAPQAGQGLSQYVNSSSSRTIPIPLGVDTVMTNIETETLRWFNVLTQGDDCPQAAESQVRHCVAIINSRLGTLIDLPTQTITIYQSAVGGYGPDEVIQVRRDGIDAVLTLAKLHHDAEKVLGLLKTRIWLADPCHLCGRKALAASDDQEWITCQGCRQTWSKDQFASLQTDPLKVQA